MSWFPDWVSGRLPLSGGHEINGGRVVYIDRHGAKECTLDRSLQLVSTHDARVQVRTVGEHLEFSGNPTKFLQGHNLYGMPNLDRLMMLFGFAICSQLGFEPDPLDFVQWVSGEIALTRVDVTRMYRPDFAQPGWVAKWLSVASSVAHGGHQRVTNRGAYEGNTLYVGQHSRRISMKLYDKAAELRRHPPKWPDEISKVVANAEAERLAKYASDTLRVEVTVRSMELKARGLDTLAAWSPATGDALIDERLSKLTVLEDLRMTDDEAAELPRHLKAAYALWRDGHDLRTVYSRRMFYYHRAALLKYGIDVAHVRPRVAVTERQHALGRPLRDYVAGPGLEPPPDDPVRLLGAS